jgi:predicted HTH transcriptional regulator
MTPEELEELIAAGHEIRGVEFKSPGPRTDKQLFARVTRAVLSMANRPDGGTVVVGVSEPGKGSLKVSGLSVADQATWTHDEVSAGLAAYADPFVSVALETVALRGKTVLVIRVQSFAEVPVICKKDYSDPKGKPVLRAGAVYVRTRRMPETSEVPSQTEMRELLDSAIQKGVRKFLKQWSAAGLGLTPAPALPTDDEQFDSELGDLK